MEGLNERAETLAAYESPKRLVKTLTEIYDTLGDVDVVVAREMTKLHEELVRGTALRYLKNIFESSRCQRAR